MRNPMTDDARVKRLGDICAQLPEVTRCLHADFIEYRVRKKLFAYFLNGHDADGIVSICVKSELGENIDRASAQPDRYYLPPYIGRKGWFGIRVDRELIDWQDIEAAVLRSYRLVAPRRLVQALG
ncbi:MAG: MmcQ/YjbR family DNA-binding protein [Burkholderiales bacterium]|nr:MAG: MmcQ/YjbR family DNA-binding protein [Burkholderiales bacterium]